MLPAAMFPDWLSQNTAESTESVKKQMEAKKPIELNGGLLLEPQSLVNSGKRWLEMVILDSLSISLEIDGGMIYKNDLFCRIIIKDFTADGVGLLQRHESDGI